MPEPQLLRDASGEVTVADDGRTFALTYTTRTGESWTVTMSRTEFDRHLRRLNRLAIRTPKPAADYGRWDYRGLE